MGWCMVPIEEKRELPCQSVHQNTNKVVFVHPANIFVCSSAHLPEILTHPFLVLLLPLKPCSSCAALLRLLLGAQKGASPAAPGQEGQHHRHWPSPVAGWAPKG